MKIYPKLIRISELNKYGRILFSVVPAPVLGVEGKFEFDPVFELGGG